MIRGSLCLCAVLVSGCTLAPDYQRPDLSTPAGFRRPVADDAPVRQRAAVDAAWWRDLGDPVLDALVQEALANNQDLRRASAVVDEFAGALTSTRSALFPQFGYGIDGGRAKLPPLAAATTIDAGLTASWEIDLFGRVRSATAAARAELLASEENRRGMVLSLVTAVVSGYVNLRSLDKQLEIAQRTAQSRSNALDLFKLRHEAGVISGVEYAQQESEYEAARAAIPALRQSIASLENALAVLLGRSAPVLPRGRGIDELALAPPPAALPSDLLERRPDLRAAEQALVAANARIGAARALYFPNISLTGLLGRRSDDLDTLFDGPSKAWSYSGSITGPVFRFGAIRGQVDTAEAAQRELLAAYQGAVQSAFADADRSLSQVQTSRDKLAAQSRQETALARYAALAHDRYDGGYTSYIDVLDAERSLFTLQLTRAQAQADVIDAVLNLYKALGGSWIDDADAINTARAQSAR